MVYEKVQQYLKDHRSDNSALYDILVGNSPIMYITVTGSLLYGTNTKKSDLDLKVIYLPSVRQLINGTASLKNSFKSTSNASHKNTSDDVDIEFIPFHEFASAVYDGQTYAIELLFSFLSTDIAPEYRYFNMNSAQPDSGPGPTYNDLFGHVCLDLQNYITNDCNSAIGFAVSQMVKYGLKGMRLSALTEIAAYLNDFSSEYNINVETSLNQLNDEFDLFTKLSEFAKQHNYEKYVKVDEYVIDPKTGVTAPCIHIMKRVVPTHRAWKYLIDAVQKYHSEYGARAAAAANNNGVDFKSVHHACRIIAQTLELQETGYLRLPLVNNEHYQFIMDVKNEKLTIEEIEQWLNHNMHEVEKFMTRSDKHTLPSKSEELTVAFNNDKSYWIGLLYNTLMNNAVKKFNALHLA